jgi:CheY-like chemotaxis protein
VITTRTNTAAIFTARGGGVSLRAAARAERLRIEVADTGIGLASSQLESIFEMFVRGADSREYGGLGIGLTLARRLVELHGGRLWAESEGVGRGSRFILELPLAGGKAVVRPAAAPATARSGGRRVLVVDDNADAARTLAALLELDGHDVRTAFSGDDALALLDGFAPELAFLDLGLPGMSGYELAERMRADARSTATRLVALTGWGREEDRHRTREAGFDAHLTKPVDPSAVLALLSG